MTTSRSRAKTPVDDWADLHGSFRWAVPDRFNIADVCCTRWAQRTPDAIAIRYEQADGARLDFSYRQLDREADRLAAALRKLGVARGDRVALVLPQRFETAVAHIAIYRLGAVAMPLSMLFGPDALEYRLNDSEARLAIVDESGIANVREARALCPTLATVIAVGAAAGQGDIDWTQALDGEAHAVQSRIDARRRCRRPHLHQRYDWPAEGHFDPASRADRQPARLRLQPELVSTGRRRVLVAR